MRKIGKVGRNAQLISHRNSRSREKYSGRNREHEEAWHTQMKQLG